MSTGAQPLPRIPDRRDEAGQNRTGTAIRKPIRIAMAPGVILPAALLLAVLGITLLGQGLTIHAKALLGQALLERAFAASIATGEPVKPWPWADTWPVARIEAPRLSRNAIVLHGSSGQALAFGPGHLEGTPAAGERGTAVYAAHRDTHFTFLADLGIGDEIRVTLRSGARSRFRVVGTSVVHWNASGIDPQAGGRALVLVTCWPFEARTAGPLRYLVHAEAIDEPGSPSP